MHRRGFIGSVLGMVAGSNFRAVEVKPDLPTEHPIAFKLRGFADLFDQNLGNIKMFTIVNGVRIFAPKIESVSYKEDRFEVKCLPISVYKSCTYEGIGILYKNKIITENRDLTIHAMNGDTIHWAYSIHPGEFLANQIDGPAPIKGTPV